MKNIAKYSIVLLALLAAIQSFAQAHQNLRNDGKVAGATPEATQCFSSGKGFSLLKICITDTGNVSTVETFSNGSVIDHIFGNEGYAVCLNAGSPTIGFDAGTVEQGWGPATVSQPNGAGKFPFIVTRDSADGTVQLKQTFSKSTSQRQWTIKMELTNISSTPLPGPTITRYFDADMDASAADDMYEVTLDSVAAQNSVVNPLDGIGHGLLLTLDSALGSLNTDHRAEAESFGAWDPLGTQGQTARQCFAQEPGLPTGSPSDQVGRLIVKALVISLNPGQTVSTTFLYRAF
jgi:hypothetical protein